MAKVGEYELLEQLGQGGMGAVWRARGPDGREVALKLLRGAGAPAATRIRFGREARVLTRLRHPHVVQVFDAGVAGETPYLALELVPGGASLQARLDKWGPFPPAEAVAIARRLAGALDHVHGQGLLHRDLKPANVLLRPDGQPLLTDFGLARDLLLPDGLTVSGQQLGTPGYWSPEQARGEVQRIGPRSDLYGLGAVLYALLTGEPPHGAPETIQAVLAAAERLPPPPSSRRPGLDPALDALCLRCLAVEPEARLGSARELEEALAAWEAARAGGVVGPRRGGLVGGAVAALVLAAGALGWLLLVAGGPPAAPRQPLPASPTPAPGEPGPAPAPAPPSPAPPSPAPSDTQRQEAARLAELGWSQQQRGDRAQALETHTRALALDPTCERALLGRALVHQMLGRPEAAREDAQRAARAHPLSAVAWCQLGMIEAAAGDAEAALSNYERALGLDPDLPMALSQRAEVRMSQGDLQGALADLDRAVELAPDDDLHLSARGQARTRAGDLRGARQDLDRAVELDPHPLTLGRRAVLRKQQGDPQGALADADRSLGLDPDQPWLVLQRSFLRELLEDPAGALADAVRATELAPKSDLAWFQRARLHASAGALKPALEAVEQAARLAPDNLEYRGVRGRLRALSGRREEGLRDIRIALAGLDPESARATELRAALRELEGR